MIITAQRKFEIAPEFMFQQQKMLADDGADAYNYENEMVWHRHNTA